MRVIRPAILIAITLGAALALSGCAPTTPEGIAEAKAKEAVDAAATGDQERYDSMMCPGDSWGFSDVSTFKEAGTVFTLDGSTPTMMNDNGLDVGGDVYDVQFLLENPPSDSRIALINVKVTGDGAPCIQGASTAGHAS